MSRIVAGLAFVAALAAGAVTPMGGAQATLISNGSFELGPDPGTFTTLNGGNTSITGWTVGGSSIDYIGTYWVAADGNRSLDMNGLNIGSISQTISGLTVKSNTSLSSISQGIPTTALQSRHLTFPLER